MTREPMAMRFISSWRGVSSIGRSFGRAKVFAVAAVLTVALGVGLSSVVFSLFDRLLFRPLPFSEPGRLVQIHSWQDSTGGREVSVNVLLELARQPDLFSGIAWADDHDLQPVVSPTAEDPTLWLNGVTTNTLDVLGLHSVIGPGFAGYPVSDLDRPVLLTYDVWQHRYGGTGRLKVGFRHFPLDRLHPLAQSAAEAAQCAADAGAFWPMHDALFQISPRLERDSLLSLGRRHVETEEFAGCVDDGRNTARVKADALFWRISE